MKVICFDVDECLEISNGPVTLESMKQLKDSGEWIVGLCGNGRKFVNEVKNWWEYISFTLNLDIVPFAFPGQMGVFPKHIWLNCFKDMWPHAERYVMVGNEFGRTNSKGFVCGSYDGENARIAGWEFILEDDFAAGVR